MAKVSGPLMSMSATGKVGGTIVFDKRGFVRKHVKPFNPQTTDQQTNRNQLGDIQRVLAKLGATIRVTVKTGMGYRWNSLVIGELRKNNSEKITDLTAIYNAFSSGNKTAWTSACPSTGLVNDAGLYFFLVSRALYDVYLRLNGTSIFPQPVETNSSTINTDWLA